MDDDKKKEFIEGLLEASKKTESELREGMVEMSESLDDTQFVVLLDAIAAIEPGPAKILLKGAAERLRKRIAN